MYRARRPFDPLKLYRLIEGKFILLQDEVEDEGEDEDDGQSDTASVSDSPSFSADGSDKISDDDSSSPPLDDTQILANKKACRFFSGLHRSKGIFWLATRPFQMGSWSTAGAMLTLGSEMPWFSCIPEEDWGADEDTVQAIKNDYVGEWGDRRQELVFIGEKLDIDGLTKMLDSCLLNRAEMRRWEKILHDVKIDDQRKEEKLQEIWDDGYWAEWSHPEAGGEHNHDHDHHHGN